MFAAASLFLLSFLSVNQNGIAIEDARGSHREGKRNNNEKINKFHYISIRNKALYRPFSVFSLFSVVSFANSGCTTTAGITA